MILKYYTSYIIGKLNLEFRSFKLTFPKGVLKNSQSLALWGPACPLWKAAL